MPRIQGDNLFLAGLLLLCHLGRRAAAGAGAPRGPRPRERAKITGKGVEGDYLRSLHTRIHYRFANKFIEDVAAKRPKTDPLNNPSLRTEVNFGVRWDGTVTDAIVTEKSGLPAFDQAAIAAIRGEKPSIRPRRPSCLAMTASRTSAGCSRATTICVVWAPSGASRRRWRRRCPGCSCKGASRKR